MLSVHQSSRKSVSNPKCALR